MAQPAVKTFASAPGTNLTDLYTVPAGRRAHVRLVQAAELGGSGDTFRIAISPGGASIAAAHYIAYDTALQANDAESWSGILLAAGDVVRVYGGSGDVSFFLSVYEDDA